LLVILACAGCGRDRGTEEQLLAQVWKRGEPARELRSGDSVAAGDELYMTLTVLSRQPLHVYVLNEDARRARQLLYPCRGGERGRPLARRNVRLPPALLGRETFWPLQTATPRERLLVLFATRPLPALEAAVPAAGAGPLCAAALSGNAGRWLEGLRIAGLAPQQSSRGAHRGSWEARESGEAGGMLSFDFVGSPDRG
jgi:hypothetical protein